MTKLFKDSIFYKSFLGLAIPMSLQNILTTTVNLTDNVLVGQLGTVPVASVGLANKIFFIFTIIVFGICGGGNAFVIQYWGKRELSGIKRIILLNFLFAIAVSLLFFIGTFFFPRGLMMLLSNDPAVIETGTTYLKAISFGYPLCAITFAFSFLTKSLEHPKIPLFTSSFTVVIDLFLNYALIFGKFGFPRLGVLGVAYGTLIARLIECILISSLTLMKVSFLRKNWREYLDQTWEFFFKYLKTTIPVTANETFWSLGTTVMAAIYARVSTQAIAAVNIVNVLYEISSVFLFGASHAAGILVGKEIGAKRKDLAYLYARRVTLIMPVISGVMGLLIFPALPLFLKLFQVEPEVKQLITTLYTIMAIYIPFRAVNHVNIVGCLRAGGDVLFCLLSDVGSLWGVGVLLALITAIWLKLPMEWVYLFSQGEELVKAAAVIFRIRKNNWIKDLVNT